MAEVTRPSFWLPGVWRGCPHRCCCCRLPLPGVLPVFLQLLQSRFCSWGWSGEAAEVVPASWGEAAALGVTEEALRLRKPNPRPKLEVRRQVGPSPAAVWWRIRPGLGFVGTRRFWNGKSFKIRFSYFAIYLLNQCFLSFFCWRPNK